MTIRIGAGSIAGKPRGADVAGCMMRHGKPQKRRPPRVFGGHGMSDSELKKRLVFSEKALEIIRDIDRVRDLSSGPAAIFSGLTRVMSDHFNAGLCLFYVVARKTGEFELKATQERDPLLRDVSALLSGAAIPEGMRDGVIRLLTAEEALPAEAAAALPPTFRVAELPVFMDNVPLGLIRMARREPAMDEEELPLMRIAESQIDSAIVQAYAQHDLVQRNKELETIYYFDNIRDRQLPFDEMLDLVLQELSRIIETDMGFVMLYDKKGRQLEMRSATHNDLLNESVYSEAINRVAYTAIRRSELICDTWESSRCTIVAVPLILRDEIIGVFGGIIRDPRRRFTEDHRRLLMAVVSQMDTAIFESLEQRRLRNVLGRSVDSRVLERLLAQPDVAILEGERVTLTVLYGDLRGSTQLAQQLQPEMLVEFINDYLGRMARVLHAHEGTLDKFIGDEVMALFGAPLPQPDHALRAVRVGLEMQKEHRKLMDEWIARGVKPAALGIGIATGEVIVGEFGYEQRTDYTIIGHTANLGARICGVAKAGQVLVSPETYEIIRDSVEASPISGVQLKGIDSALTVWAVTRIRD